MSRVVCTVGDNVAVLRLDDPDHRNVLTAGLIDDLIAALDRCEGDESVSAVVLTSEGSAFWAGAHRDDLAAAVDAEFDRQVTSLRHPDVTARLNRGRTSTN